MCLEETLAARVSIGSPKASFYMSHPCTMSRHQFELFAPDHRLHKATTGSRERQLHGRLTKAYARGWY